MHVLVIGAGGFIGRHVAGRLLAEGGRVTLAGRTPSALARLHPRAATLACDLARDDAEAWAPRLAGIDAVVNCAGVIGDRADHANVHDRGARALFDACRAAGVGRVVQISALGADASGVTRFHRSKRSADDHLAALDPTGERMGWAILRPSLVLGRGGASTALFTTLAALPLSPSLDGGDRRLRPIHVDDLVEAVVRLLRRPGALALRLDAAGPETMTTDALTAELRRWLGLPPAPRLPVPNWSLALVACLGIGPVSRESLTMLRAGNTAPIEPFVATLGFRPSAMADALARHPAAPADLVEARLRAVAPALPLLLALVWFAGGLVSLAAAPAEVVARHLAEVGLTGRPATAVLWAGSLADVAIGLALIARLRGAALAGIALMLVYTAILTLAEPAAWADPFGALVKNLAVLGLSLTVHAMEVPHARA